MTRLNYQEFRCDHPDDLDSIAEKLIRKFPESRLFAFYGEMGSGKTTFIKAICRYLNVNDVASSPTFAIINVYHTEEKEAIYHFDFYRMKTISEVYDIGYEDYFYSGSYCFFEWPEKIEKLLDENVVDVHISVVTGNNSRIIKF